MKHYTFVDYATQGYVLVVGLLIVGLHGARLPLWPALVAAHVVTLAAVHLLIRFHGNGKAGRGGDFLRHFYPVPLYTGFYRETGELHHMIYPGFLDPVIIRLDQWVFGFQPSLAFMDHLPYLAVSEIFYAAYFSYYLMIAGVGLALFLRNREQFFHYVSVVSFVFYVCYLIYIFLPVMGPRSFFRDPKEYILPYEVQPAEVPPFPEAIKVGPFYQVMAVIYRNLESPGAAFPSSHVALAVTTAWFSWLYLRRIRYLHLLDVVLLCLSTVYCRYHYAVDVVAGLLTAGLLVPLADRLYFKFRHVGHPTRLAPPPPSTGVSYSSRS
jgi:membrane-associated phospholipid phosphatase